MKRTKIVATIGPASKDSKVLEAMIRSGMNVARLNMSHGTQADHRKLFAAVRGAARKLGEPVAILADLQGPKIRVGDLPKEGVQLKNGAIATFTTGAAGAGKIPVGYKRLHRDVKKGDRILLDDGLLEVEVREVRGRDIATKIITGGLLTSHKGMNCPTASLSVSALTPKDKADAKFAVSLGVDFIALSFVRRASDVRALRKIITAAEKSKKGPPIMIIVKIEKHEALRNFNEILRETDAVMVARGDLAVETPAAEVPLHQKTIIGKCLAAAKPAIVATQMLDSMTRNPRPTRAEVSDVANAVIDHTDAVMLSGESATGKFPVEAVRTLASVAEKTESSVFDDLAVTVSRGDSNDTEEIVGETAGLLARTTKATAIVAASLTGETARQISRFRPELPVYVAASEERVLRQMNLSWGIRPFLLPLIRPAKRGEIGERALLVLRKIRKIKKGDRVILISGEPGVPGGTNTVSMVTI
ncbi:pyruvate kinase [Candidatus Uhrbacteria bacterium RIFCSPHIGHO2_02_FULL_57_19]|uniref:Pyruvate kinase n=1 Tax=Candidatus Uhrbacteria bacterium RIFCSPHIGHO2_02_FULL_57_19 TaxID=1802391 RepID=A0A1F7U3L2_9BACT|nr:MAG: pyruvate kinase [Candidatus Uhrbacteria bacterium RIFCSPHIGHO2_02_FULL_57_19]